MACFVANLSIGKGSWSELIKIIELETWDKIILITNDFGKEKFSCKKTVELILINDAEPLQVIVNKIISELKDKLTGTEVGLSLISGTGKEHNALLAALMKLGFGFRLVTYENNKVVEV